MTSDNAVLAAADSATGTPHERPRVSVLIPLYNSAATIARAIGSAQAQTLADIEILVADDASTDDGAAIVQTLADADPRIVLLRLPVNGGKPRAMNLMTRRAVGEWLAVLDADDAYHPARLETLLAAAAAAGTDMAADNLRYLDSGAAEPGEFGRLVRTGFDPALGERILAKQDLLAEADSFGAFDFGILKPVIRRDFILAHQLAYYEQSRLAEDFTYLMECLVAGGRVCLVCTPLYDWTMPFGPLSRSWTRTGAGAWRYDYGPALEANAYFIDRMSLLGETGMVAMLRRRGRQYQVMIHYIAAQRLAARAERAAALKMILSHPSTWPLLGKRVAGRLARVLRRRSRDLAA